MRSKRIERGQPSKSLKTNVLEMAPKGESDLISYTEGVSEIPALLSGFPVVTTIPLLWGDQDAFGHANNLVYLRWCETSRVEYLMRAGLWSGQPPNGTGPILASVKCDYKAPLGYPDKVQVGTRVSGIGNSSLRMEHRVVSRKLGKVAAAVDSVLVWFDYEQERPAPVPEEARRTIEELEGKPVGNLRAPVAAG